MFFVFLIALVLYIFISLYLVWALVTITTIKKLPTLTALGIALIAHAVVLYPTIITIYGLNFNLFSTTSLISLFFLLFYVLFCLYRPILSLGIFAAPIAAVGLSLGYMGVAPYQPLTNMGTGLEVHIILSIAAYCVLAMAAVQALIIRLQIRELKHQTVHRFWVSKLPSLQSMESLLFDMLLLGFVLLTIALATGFVYVQDLFAQHLVHKTVLSVLSWLIFGGLLVGHWQAGWRGRRAANMTLLAFALLAVGFMGSKFVLEIILLQ